MDDEEIHSLCEHYGMKDYEIVDGKVSITNTYASVRFSEKLNGCIPIPFGVVGSDFYCASNEMTTLKNSPRTVNGGFYCTLNHLTTLEYGPLDVTGDYDCSSNHLPNLKHAPKNITGGFDCSHNRLTSLEHGPGVVSSYFRCVGNPLLSLSEILKWYKKSGNGAFMITGHRWLDEFLNITPEKKDTKWDKDFNFLLRKYCND